jgi:hypothetical protein
MNKKKENIKNIGTIVFLLGMSLVFFLLSFYLIGSFFVISETVWLVWRVLFFVALGIFVIGGLVSILFQV